MGKILKKLLKMVVLVAVVMYSLVTFAKQETQFKKYDNDLQMYNNLIDEENLKHEQLSETKNRISTDEYIEEVARDRLGLVKPNEIVFIDASL